jgi:hypothetical protein
MRENALRHPVFVLFLTVVLFGGGCGGWFPLLPDGEGGEGRSCDSWGEVASCGDSGESIAASKRIKYV